MKRFSLLCVFLLTLSFSEGKNLNKNKDGDPLINSGKLIEEGLLLHNESKYDLAIEKFLQVPESDTNFVMMRSELINSYIENKNYKEAIELGEWGIREKSAYKAHFYAALGIAYEYNEARERAIETYLAGLKLYPNNYYLYYNLGVSLFKKEDFEQAITQFEKSITLNPFYSNSHVYLADIMVKQGKRARAMMCLSTYMALVPENNKVLVIMNDLLKSSLAYENTAKSEEKLAHFRELDLLIKSNAALDKKFKSAIRFKAPVAQQTELLLESVAVGENTNDFWMQFYVPLYVKIHKSGLKQAFIYHLLTSVKDKGVQKWLKSNEKELNRYFELVNQHFKSFRSQGMATVGGENGTYTFWYYDNHTLNAIGNQKDEETYYGPWVFYHTNGELLAEGSFLPDGNKTGKWSYYYEDGTIEKREEYDGAGKLTGIVTNYYPNGKILNEVPLKDEKVEGLVRVYYSCGQLKEELSYKDGKKNGAGKAFYPSGQLNSVYSFKEGELDGKDTYYYKNGKVKEEYTYKEGKLNGPFKSFSKRNILTQQGHHEEGKRSGEWVGYYEDGTIEFKGKFANGEKTGLWINYYEGGKVKSEDLYNQEGKLDGKSRIFLEDGTLQSEYMYKDGLLIAYAYYNRQKQLLSEASDTKGNFKLRAFYPDGVLNFEGSIVKGKKEGEWKYYHHNGEISTICNFKEDQYHGLYQYFFESGQKSVETHYVDGVEDGFYRSFFRNGQVKFEGWVVNGVSEQSWVSYFPDGKVNFKQYYLNGELHGTYQEFDKLGRPYIENKYNQGSLIQKTLFDTLGGIIRADVLDMGNGKVSFSFADKTPGYEFDLLCNEFHSDMKSYHKKGALFYHMPYKNGESNGRYQSFYANKKPRSAGDYVDGEQSGLWIWYYESGKLETKLFLKDGELDGERFEYYENGQLSSVANYKDGKRIGSTIYYAPDGSVQIEKEYDEHGLKRYRYLKGDNKFCEYIAVENNDGVVKAYYPNGKVSIEQTYKKSFLDGVQLSYYPSGQILEKRILRLGEEEGVREEYFPDGKLQKSSPYKDGELHGQVIEYYPSGQIKRRTSYLYGEKEGWEEKFDMKGKLISKEFYRDDFAY